MCLEFRAHLLQLSALTFPGQEDPIKKKKVSDQIEVLACIWPGKIGCNV